MCYCIALRRIARQDAAVQLSMPQMPGVGAIAAAEHCIKCACVLNIIAPCCLSAQNGLELLSQQCTVLVDAASNYEPCNMQCSLVRLPL
jgi:hypothetical protein